MHSISYARVHPRISTCSTATSISLERETFTLWMKSLVLHGNGLTIFNSDGQIVYRIDNYATKHNREVYLMDLRGNVVYTLLRRKWRIFEEWECYNFEGHGKSCANSKPWFRVRNIGVAKKGMACQVTMKNHEKIKESRYQIKGCLRKSEFKILDQSALVIAEVTRKTIASSGVTFGNDVLRLVVEPNVDTSFVIALVAVVGLISRLM